MKSFRSTLILTAVCAALFGWYFLYEKKWKPTQTAQEEKQKQLVTYESMDIQELTVKRGDKTIQFKKAGEEWNLVAPIQDAADVSIVNSLLTTLGTTRQERVVEENPKELDGYGLKNPGIVIEVKKDAQSPVQSVALGKDTPVGFSLYARAGNTGPVYRISKALKTAADKDLKDWRNKNIVPLSRFDLSEVEIQNGKETFSVKKNDKDQWILTRESLPADNNEWTKGLNTILDLKAMGFAADDDKNLAKYGLAPAAVKILLTKKDKSRHGILVGKANGKVYAKREDKPVVYEVDKGTMEKLVRPASAYRSLDLVQMNRFDVKRLKIERGKDTLELLKDGQKWTLATEPKTEIDNEKVDLFLTHLQDGRITKYLPDVKDDWGLKSPALTLHIFEKMDAGEKETATLKFGKVIGKDVAVQRSDLTIPLIISSDLFKKINLEKKDFQPSPKATTKSETPKTGQKS